MTDNFDFLSLARERCSVRKFSDEPIPKESLERILTAGMVAPTACNRQPQRILVINSQEGIRKLKMCTECHFNANTAMLICYSRSECWKREYDGKTSGDIDAAIVTTHMMLEAASLGIGSTWVMYFIPEAVKCEYELNDDLEPVALLVMGYPAKGTVPSPLHEKSKGSDDIITYV